MSIQDLVGKWRLENWENFEEFMKEAGVGFIIRKAGNAALNFKPTIEIIVDGDNVTLDVKSTFKNQTVKSVLGKDFDEDTMDGRRVLSTITFENGKLIHTQKATKKGDQTTVVTRYREGDKMITIFRCNEVTSRWELSRV